MDGLARDYFLFVFLAGLGTLQIAASYSRLKGMLFLRNCRYSRLLGLAFVIAALVWFLIPGPRNVSDTEGGLDGNIQALLFALGSLSAVVVTLLGSSVVNARLRGNSHQPDGGFEALKEANYAQALWASMRYRWKKWQKRIPRYFSG